MDSAATVNANARRVKTPFGKPQPARTYAVRVGDPLEDRTAILALLRANGVRISEQQYLAKYEGNPLGRARCWLAVETRENNIVGHVALFPRGLLVDGRRHPAAVVGDFVVDVAHRSFWPAFLLQRALITFCNEHTFEFLYTFPNRLSHPVLLRAGYRSVGSFRNGVKLLEPKTALKQRYPYLAAPGISHLLNLGLKWFSTEYTHHDPAFYAREVPSFDETFTNLWASVLPRCGVALERQAAYANWRFQSSRDRRYSIFAVTRSAKDTVDAYLVWTAEQGKARVLDLLASKEALPALLVEFIRSQRQQKSHSIVVNYFGDPALEQCLRQFGFVFRDATAEVVVYAAPGVIGESRIAKREEWYFLQGDSDVE